MPNRYLRASYIDSERINSLTAEAERLFCRLLVHVDDFGRCEACPALLRGKLFARKLDTVSESDVKRWVEELAAKELLFLYVVGGKVFVQYNTWEHGRAKTSRCPQPPTDVSRRMRVYARENISPDSDSGSDSDPGIERETRARGSKPSDWLEALRASGKLPDLTYECLLSCHRGHESMTAEDWASVVEAAKSMPGVIGSPSRWLVARFQERSARYVDPAVSGESQSSKDLREYREKLKREREVQHVPVSSNN